MDQHISFGDLVTFVWMDALTPEMKQLALRVNAHLVGCPECQEKVTKLQQLHQEAQDLRQQKNLLLEANRRLAESQDRVIPFLRQQVETLEFSAANDQEFRVAEEGVIHYPDEE
jgi:hypothetical protein